MHGYNAHKHDGCPVFPALSSPMRLGKPKRIQCEKREIEKMRPRFLEDLEHGGGGDQVNR